MPRPNLFEKEGKPFPIGSSRRPSCRDEYVRRPAWRSVSARRCGSGRSRVSRAGSCSSYPRKFRRPTTSSRGRSTAVLSAEVPDPEEPENFTAPEWVPLIDAIEGLAERGSRLRATRTTSRSIACRWTPWPG